MSAPTASVRARPAGAPPAPRLRLGRRARRALLTAHIAVSVGLLGDSAGYLAVAVRAAGADDPAAARAAYEILDLFAFAFGIPLSLAALATGLALGWTSSWGVLRTPWVAAKLALLVSVIAVGALVLGPGVAARLDGGGSAAAPIAGATWDVAALALATGLSVFRPGRPRARRAQAAGSSTS